MTEVNHSVDHQPSLSTFNAAGAEKTEKREDAPVAAQPSPAILGGPSLSVSAADAAIAGLQQASYESKMATAKNLVDDPETRREKAERREEAEAKDALAKADMKRYEDQRALLDEIDSNRPHSV